VKAPGTETMTTFLSFHSLVERLMADRGYYQVLSAPLSILKTYGHHKPTKRSSISTISSPEPHGIAHAVALEFRRPGDVLERSLWDFRTLLDGGHIEWR